jgi:hypothetical protein
MDYRIDKYVTPQWLFDQHLKSDSIHEYGIGVAIRHAIIKRYVDGYYDEARDLYKRYKSYRDFDRYVGLYIDIRDNGFDKTQPVTVHSIKNIINNGSHRVACSLVLSISTIPIQYRYNAREPASNKFFLIDDLPGYLKNHEKGYTLDQVDLILESLNMLTA